MDMTLVQANQDLRQVIQTALEQGPIKRFAKIEGDFGLPKDYFDPKPFSFWAYAPEGALDDWHFCISRLQPATEVVSGVFIGTMQEGVFDQLCRNDYTVKSNDHNMEHHKILSVAFTSDRLAQGWIQVSNTVFGSEHPKISFTRIITVIRTAKEEEEVREKISGLVREGCQYSFVKEHLYVRLIDLVKNDEEKLEQKRQWEVLTGQFPNIFAVIDRARSEGEPILIHCGHGRHRSAAILHAYLVDRLGLPLKEVNQYTQSRRGCIIGHELSEFSGYLSDWASK